MLLKPGADGNVREMQKYISAMIFSMPLAPVKNCCDNLTINAFETVNKIHDETEKYITLKAGQRKGKVWCLLQTQ